MVEVQPKYVLPGERDYSNYNDHLIAYNRRFQRQISKELTDFFGNCSSNLNVATSGSDARLEKGPNSQIELILLGDDPEVVEESKGKLIPYISSEKNEEIFYPHIETKKLHDEKLYEYTIREGTPQERRIMSPNRIFDLRMLFEKDNILLEVIGNFIEEIRSPQGRSVLKKIKGRVKDHAEVTLSGIQPYRGKYLHHYNPDQELYLMTQIKVYGPLNKVLLGKFSMQL